MDKAAAQKLVRETLRDSFDKGRFVYLLKNILNRFDESKAFHARGHVKEKFRTTTPIIKTYERTGTYSGPDGKKTDLLIVYLQKESSIDRARTALRNFVADYLKQRDMKDAALVAFVPPDGEDWRFSFIKMEYTFNEKGKVEEEFTPARRYSFLVGKHETSHTAQSRLLPLLLDDEGQPTLKDLEDAFSVEKTTKEFFEKYRDLFLRLEESLDAVLKKDVKVKTDFKAKDVHIVDFAKKLLGQIVFLYFLQKKGWFGVQRGCPWGSGSKHFLRELFDKKHGDYNNFFNDILEPLFYEALRLERPGDYYKHFDCRIPFLNGGLFDPINDYDWIETEILLSDDLFSNNCPTKEGDVGDGILDVFDRYNFTVKEDEPLEKEVAVDPEMLGKVFENLLEIKNRKSKGTYYTPREIVHYMCQESLIEYLYGEFNPEIVAYETIGDDQMAMFGNEAKKKQLDLTIEHRQRSLIDKKDIETLIRYGESVVEHERRVVNEGRETDRYSFKLPERLRANASRIDEKLASVRVCDPAVGSGAFVVGMMNEIVRARGTLTPHIDENEKRTPYDFKRHAIQNCLYGVDIDSGAIEVAKLRLWLSLVVDEEERESIQPLPNLDYKIVCGNSLLGVNKLFNHEPLKKLEALKPLYFNETSAVKKQKHKKQIDDLISQMTNGYKDFDFEVYFSEVFHEKKGFDVVLGNPPYVALQKNGGELRKLYRDAGFTTFAPTGDVYQLFYERGCQLLVPSVGLLAYITSNSWLKAEYGKSTRRYFADNHTPLHLIELGKDIFESAIVDSSILITRQGKHDETGKAVDMDRLPDKDFPPPENRWAVFQSQRDKPWSTLSDIEQSIMDKIEEIGTPLKEWNVSINYGIKTGYNPAFIIDDATKQALIDKDRKSAVIIKPVLRGRDIQRYKAQWVRLWLIDTHNGYGNVPSINIDNYPAIKNHLNRFYPQLKRRQDRGRTPYNLRNCAYHEEFAKEKLFWMDMSNRGKFAYSEKEMYCNNKGFMMTGKSLKYLCAVLNSALITWLMKNTARTTGMGLMQWEKFAVERLPIPKIPIAEQRPFIRLVDAILSAKAADPRADTTEQEAKIDRLAYALYGLTTEEIAAVES
ncbi:MAG: Eco57I restriction-modification methylase domain-containing protein [Candidatus Poribacteria bacterium]|nr:Eco57I restriction-modification methylase domain-containing protein [Candidatus Poribacteria bacterium]